MVLAWANTQYLLSALDLTIEIHSLPGVLAKSQPILVTWRNSWPSRCLGQETLGGTHTPNLSLILPILL